MQTGTLLRLVLPSPCPPFPTCPSDVYHMRNDRRRLQWLKERKKRVQRSKTFYEENWSKWHSILQKSDHWVKWNASWLASDFCCTAGTFSLTLPVFHGSVDKYARSPRVSKHACPSVENSFSLPESIFSRKCEKMRTYATKRIFSRMRHVVW